jgi:mono/diheme cytochrome c family protein
MMSLRGLVGLFWCGSLIACGDDTAGTDAGTPPPPPADAGFIFDVELGGDPVARGKDLFRNLRCANCHGVDGQGSPNFPGAPTLVGRSAEDLRIVLVESCDVLTAGSGCHPLKIPEVPQRYLEDIAAYLASLAASSPDHPGPPCDAVPGNICTLAGTGNAGNIKNPAIRARQQRLFWPQNVTVDPQGRVVITDWNNYLIRRIEPQGCQDGDCPIVNIIGSGALGDECSTAARPVMAANMGMNHPVGTDYLPNGDIVLWGWHMWKIKYIPMNSDGTAGQAYCLFGNARGFSGDGMAAGTNFDGMGGPTRFNLPSSAVLDNDGNWWISDQANLRIRIVRPDGDDLPPPPASSAEAYVLSLRNNVITTLAGGEPLGSTGEHRRTLADYSDSGDGGPLTAATFRVQFGFDAIPQMRMAYDRTRDLIYLADAENNRIRIIDRSVDPWTIDTFAGGGTDVTGTDIDARSARLYRPGDVDVIPDGSGDVLITDTYNNCIRVVDFDTRRIRTVAGVCGADTYGYEGDGGPALAARIAEPGGAGAGPDRTIYIADTLNHRIRKVNPTP